MKRHEKFRSDILFVRIISVEDGLIVEAEQVLVSTDPDDDPMTFRGSILTT